MFSFFFNALQLCKENLRKRPINKNVLLFFHVNFPCFRNSRGLTAVKKVARICEITHGKFDRMLHVRKEIKIIKGRRERKVESYERRNEEGSSVGKLER